MNNQYARKTIQRNVCLAWTKGTEIEVGVLAVPEEYDLLKTYVGYVADNKIKATFYLFVREEKKDKIEIIKDFVEKGELIPEHLDNDEVIEHLHVTKNVLMETGEKHVMVSTEFVTNGSFAVTGLYTLKLGDLVKIGMTLLFGSEEDVADFIFINTKKRKKKQLS